MTPIQEALLHQLADGALHSGTALGEALGISRAGVWKQIQQLHAVGVEVQSIERQGYRLPALIQFLDQQKIEAALAPAVGMQLAGIQTVWECDSTNSELIRQLHTGARPGTLLLAEHQTAGRGRRGREWVSPFGGSLYLSLLWRFSSGPMALSGVSIVVGIAAAQALIELGVEGVALKWPNDIHLQGRKLGGVLIDQEGESEGPTHVVIGIGINVALPERESRRIGQPWAALSQQMESLPSRNRLAASLLNRLVPLLNRFEQGGLDPLLPEWEPLDQTRDRTVTLQLEGRHITGTARGIDRTGALQLERGGRIRPYFSGDLSLRLQEPA